MKNSWRSSASAAGRHGRRCSTLRAARGALRPDTIRHADQAAAFDRPESGTLSVQVDMKMVRSLSRWLFLPLVLGLSAAAMAALPTNAEVEAVLRKQLIDSGQAKGAAVAL